MHAPEDSRSNLASPDRQGGRSPCAVCGGELSVLIEVTAQAQPAAPDHPVARYFRCTRCAQIQIVDEWMQRPAVP